ncbi:MAG TPA: hypothetical protein VF780_04230 [Nitrosospira sp.]
MKSHAGVEAAMLGSYIPDIDGLATGRKPADQSSRLAVQFNLNPAVVANSPKR